MDFFKSLLLFSLFPCLVFSAKHYDGPQVSCRDVYQQAIDGCKNSKCKVQNCKNLESDKNGVGPLITWEVSHSHGTTSLAAAYCEGSCFWNPSAEPNSDKPKAEQKPKTLVQPSTQEFFKYLKAMTTPFVDRSTLQCGSVISTDNQVLGEVVPVVGTNFHLAFFTNKVVGRKGDYTLQIPLTGFAQLDPGFTEVKYSVKINGVTVVQNSQALTPKAAVNYEWSGKLKDQIMLGSALAEVEVQYLPGGQPITATMPIGSLQALKFGLGGWIPTVLHFYDIVRKTLLRGDGSSLSISSKTAANGTIEVVDGERAQVHIFDKSGKLLETKTKFLGSTVYKFEYSNDLLVGITDAFKKKTTFKLNGDMALITAFNGQETILELDPYGYLAEIMSPAGTFSVNHSENGLLNTFKKPIGQTSIFKYDDLGNLITDAHSGGYTIGLKKSVDGTGAVTITSTTQAGRKTLIKTENLNGQSVKTVTKPNGQTTKTWTASDGSEYSELNQVTKFKTEFKPDARFGNLSKMVSSQSYEKETTKIKVTKEEVFGLSDSSNPYSIINYRSSTADQNGLKTQLRYDGSTKQFQTLSAHGSTVVSIDEFERPVKIWNYKNDSPVIYSYSGENLMSAVQKDRKFQFSYDSRGKLSSMTDSLGQITKYIYDDAGNLISIEYPDSKTVQYTYDGNSKLVGITPANKATHGFKFNDLELQIGYNLPALASIASKPVLRTYNADKHISSMTKSDGSKISYKYNEDGTLSSVETSEGSYSYKFNKVYSKYTSAKTPQNLTATRFAQNNTSLSDTLSKPDAKLSSYAVTMDSTGRITGDVVSGIGTIRNDPGLIQINYTYDNNGKVKQVGNQTISYEIYDAKFESDRINGTSTVVGQNAIIDGISYNGYGELSAYVAKHNASNFYFYKLEYDLMGRVSKKTESLLGSTQIFDYSYDLSNHLKEVKKNGVVVSIYKYDSNGNRISGNTNGQAISGKYDAQDQLIVYNANSYTNNPNGDLVSKKNTISGQITKYDFNSLGLLQGTMTGTNSTAYQYDGFGRRVFSYANGKFKNLYVYMSQTRLAGVVTNDGVVYQRFTYATKSQVPDVMIMNQKTYRIITDHLGSVRLVIGVEDGVVAQEMMHDEFGRVVKDTNPGFQPFGFAGGLYDPNSGLVQFGARWYDSETGRWISKDPSRFDGGNNLYSYVNSDPINSFDPLGLWSVGANAYLGFGGGLSFGQNPDDQWFFDLQLGLGIGAGASFNKNGTSPDWGNERGKNGGPALAVGGFMDAGINIGPIGAGLSVSKGLTFLGGVKSTTQGYQTGGANASLTPALKAGAGVSIGAEFCVRP